MIYQRSFESSQDDSILNDLDRFNRRNEKGPQTEGAAED